MTQFEVSAIAPLPIEAVWEAHENVQLLEQVAPPIPKIRLIEPNVICQRGTQFTVRIELLGTLGLNWQAEITRWEPPHCFTDAQIRGPFRLWEHTHRFFPLSRRATRMIDAIQFELNPMLDEAVLRPALQTMFQMRMQNLKQNLARRR